jgi:1-acyl-sn-glycerol-3-phosphate acyltransferase
MPLIFVRSLIFNAVFYAALVVWLIVALPTFVLPRRAIIAVAKLWARQNIVLMRVICNIRVDYRGLANIPSGPLLVASKHQSMWETFALVPLFDDPLYILKRELTRIPLFGWYLVKAGMIAVDRKAGARALIRMTHKAVRQVQTNNRQLIIFPEGTRRPVGAAPAYKPGIAQIYADCGVPCVPVALNSALFWPRRTFLRYPGTLVVEFLPLVPPGLPRREFVARITTTIEQATNALTEAGRAEQARLFGRDAKAAAQDA